MQQIGDLGLNATIGLLERGDDLLGGALDAVHNVIGRAGDYN